MNLMDNGSIDIGDFRVSSIGEKLGMSPVSVSCNNFPLRSTLLLLMLPPSGVRWYSSRDNATSDDLVPIHETPSLIVCASDLLFLLSFFSPTSELVYAVDSMLIRY